MRSLLLILVFLLVAGAAAGTALAAGDKPVASEEETSEEARPRRDAPPDEDRLTPITRRPRSDEKAGEAGEEAEPEAKAGDGVTRAAEPHGTRAGVSRKPAAAKAEAGESPEPEADGAEPVETDPAGSAEPVEAVPGEAGEPAPLAAFPEVDDLLIRHRRAAVALSPDSAGAWVDLGNAYAKDFRAETALAAYDRALAVDPGFAAALNNRCGVLLSENRDTEALPACQQAVEGDPHNAVSHYLVGIAYDRHFKYQEAMDHYQTALTINPRFKLASVNPNIVNNRHLQILNLRLYREKGGSMVLPLQPGGTQ